MPRPSTIVALLAAVILVISGGWALAGDRACNPCPADCPMMQASSNTAMADHHAPQPNNGGAAEAPCKQGVLCQTSVVAAPIPFHSPVALARVSAADVLRPGVQLPAASRPPDRSLRPPIQL